MQDMAIYDPSDYLEYNTVNELFIRHLANGTRPINMNSSVLVSPCDARVLTFTQVPNDFPMYLKGKNHRSLILTRKSIGCEYFIGRKVHRRVLQC